LIRVGDCQPHRLGLSTIRRKKRQKETGKKRLAMAGFTLSVGALLLNSS